MRIDQNRDNRPLLVQLTQTAEATASWAPSMKDAQDFDSYQQILDKLENIE